jgi:hypothetical protein
MGIFDGIAGGIIGGIGNYFGQKDTNKANRDINRENNAFNAAQNALNRQWQENMSNTAYQRSRADMEKAGINPILAAGGPGASSPSGSAASSSTPIAQQNVVTPAINTALAVANAYEDILNKRKTNVVLESQANLNNSSARNVAAQADIHVADEPKRRIKGRLYEKVNTALDLVERNIPEKHRIKDIQDSIDSMTSSALKASSWGRALHFRR